MVCLLPFIVLSFVGDGAFMAGLSRAQWIKRGSGVLFFSSMLWCRSAPLRVQCAADDGKGGESRKAVRMAVFSFGGAER